MIKIRWKKINGEKGGKNIGERVTGRPTARDRDRTPDIKNAETEMQRHKDIHRHTTGQRKIQNLDFIYLAL